MPKSLTTTPSGREQRARRCATSTPKASSPRKMLPTPATSTLALMCSLAIHWTAVQNQWLHFFGRKEEAVPRLAQHSQVAPRIIFKDNRQMNSFVKIVLNRFNHREPALQCQIHDVGRLLRPEANAVPSFQCDTKDHYALDRFAVLFRAPLHHGSSLAE